MRRALSLLPALVALSCAGAPPTTGKVKLVGAPRDATVIVDDVVVGDLGVVSKYGLKLPKGRHRVTVERAGYFPWDRVVVAGDEPVALEVSLQPLPEE